MHFGGGVIGDWICHVLDPVLGARFDAPSRWPRSSITIWRSTATYPPGSRSPFESRGKERGPVKLVWHDGNTATPAQRFSAR
jgi:hypothetical protein